MADGGQDFNLGHVVGSAGEKGDDGSTVWNTSTAPSYANSKYTFNISNLSGKTGLQIAVNDIIFYSTYYYIVSAVNTTTVDCSTRVSIKGSDASVTIVDNLTSTSSTSALSAKQGKVLNDNKIETSSIATSFGSTPSDSKVASEKLVKNSLDAKQATLVSGTNIKTINNNSLLGSGNINIESGSNVDVVTSWEATLSDTKVPSEKLTKNSLDAKAPTSHASSSSTYGLGTTANYGHVKTINGLTQSSHSDGTALSAYQGKVLKDEIDAKPDSSDIPTKTSDLANDSNYISTSSTSGLIKNDGTIDTTSYSTFSGSYNDLSNKPTIPSASSTVPSADTSSGSYGSGTSYARSNHSHPKSSLYAESSHTHTKSQITDFPSIPSSSSDLSDGSDLIKKSSTSGLIKNNGTIDTNSYLTTSSASSTYQTKLVSGTSIKTVNNESLLGSGNITIQGGSNVDVVTSWEATLSDTKVPSEKLVKNTIDGLSIPTKTSDLTNDGDGNNAFLTQHQSLTNYIQKSSTSGLVKNDGTIDTSSYLTSSALSNYMQKSSTSGLMKNDGSVDTNTYLTSSAISGMLTSSDIANNLTTTASGKVLDARQGKALADLIGDAIAYINQ